MAKSLIEARREAAERTAEGVDACERDGLFGDDDDQPHWAKVADGKALRGIPAISANSEGSAILGTQPGWDLFDDE